MTGIGTMIFYSAVHLVFSESTLGCVSFFFRRSIISLVAGIIGLYVARWHDSGFLEYDALVYFSSSSRVICRIFLITRIRQSRS